MSPDPRGRADALFDRALDLPAADRAAFLDAACPGDPAVRAAVESLLAHADRAEADGFLAAPAPLPPRPAGPPAVPGYEVVRELGRGGGGVVYLARQVGLRRPVALKVVGGGRFAGPDERARFRREAEAAARLGHPGIVAVYDVGEQDGCPYLALEYVPGGTLAARLAGAPLPAREAAGLAEAVARAVDHAHRAGVVHRDLKPANILLQIGDLRSKIDASEAPGPALQSSIFNLQSSTPKVADFGLAAVSGDATGLTATGAVMGTPSYMAPEQAEGRPAGPAADVYALGAVLYECLTGRPPFKAATAVETLVQVRDADPVPPSRLQPGLPRDLGTVCLKCLRKDPGGRYGSAGELADDLRRFLDGRPVAARPVPAAARAWKWVRRNRGVAAALAVAAVALGGGTGVASWQAVAAVRAKGQADRAAEREGEARAAAVRQFTDTADQFYLMTTSFYPARADELDGRIPLEADRAGGVSGVARGPPLIEELTARLQQTAARLDRESVGDPRLAARLRVRIGQSLINLDRGFKAASVLKPALDELRDVFGPDDPETLACWHALACAQFRADLFGEAVESARRCLERRAATLGESDRDTLATMGVLVRAYQAVGRAEEALRVAREARERWQGVAGGAAPDTADGRRALAALNDLAEAYRRAAVAADGAARAATAKEAIDRAHESLRLSNDLLRRDDGLVLAPTYTVGQACLMAGRYDEAVDHFRRFVPGARRRLGVGTLEFAKALERVATGLVEHARYAAAGSDRQRARLYAEADPYLRECIDVRDELEDGHWRSGHVRFLLGASLLGRGRLTDAEPFLLDGQKRLEAHKGRIPASIRAERLRNAADGLAELYERLGRPEAARWRAERDKYPPAPPAR